MKSFAGTLGRTARLALASSLVALAAMDSCDAQITKAPQVRIFGTWWPSARSESLPSGDYELAREQMWVFVLDALKRNRIDAISKDVEQGVIETEFLYPDSGRIVTNATLQVRRFCYRIRVSASDASHTHVEVVPRIELASQVGWNRQPGALEWSEVTTSAGYGKVVDVLRLWLYEEIDEARH